LNDCSKEDRKLEAHFYKAKAQTAILTQEEEVTKDANDVSDSYDGDIFCFAFQA
jgi:hypothetical protein